MGFRSSTVSFPAGNASTVSCPTPAGTVSTDVMLAFVTHFTANVISPPSGWTLLGKAPGGSGVTLSAYSRNAGAIAASEIWSNSASTIAWEIALRSYNEVQLPDLSAFAKFDTNTNWDAPSLSPGAAAILVCGWSYRDGTMVPPVSMGDPTTHGSKTTQYRVITADEGVPVGATGIRRATYTVLPSDYSGAAVSVTLPLIVAPTSSLKRWDGAAWVSLPVSRWDGAAWANTDIKRWDGAAWNAI